VNASVVDYGRMAFDLIDDFEHLQTTGEVMSRMEGTLSGFGYNAFLVTGMPEPPQRVEPHFLLNGWPDGFTERYVRANYYLDDPVAARCRRSIDPFEWSEACSDLDAWPRAAEVMNVAADFGMRKGFCVPIVRGNGSQACVTVAGESPDFDPHAKRAIHLISLYAHAKAITLVGIDDDKRPRERILTGREREVLTWTAAGKSSWEISVILGVTERTVNWTVQNAMRKLDASTRTQAVVNAIRAKEIEI
jgi:LuxR family quorum sensing-dependent transcriptional regulator